ncbi:MAG: peptide chain release factor N(5)-glutamine methyltransferase [Planctomycetes bacterium]|nr:peptide chain release factor N(5)-glutamine methyltransferase [Planctomycetota bacterium]
MTERWTVGRLAASAAELLRNKGFESARLEADLLLAESLGIERLELYTRFDMPVPDELRDRFRGLIRRRLAHEPVAYILGRRDFLDWTFRVRAGVLVPRPESEHLVAAALAGLADDRDLELLEVGVGSGCLMLSLLARRPRARGLGLDLEAIPLEVSVENAELLGVGDRFEARRSDFYAALGADAAGRFDLVISNPPYIRPEERAELDPDLGYEPEAALFHPGDGIEFHRRLLLEGVELLADGGFFVLELPGAMGAALRGFCAEALPDLVTAVVRDYAGRDRVFLARKSGWTEGLSRHLESADSTC